MNFMGALWWFLVHSGAGVPVNGSTITTTQKLQESCTDNDCSKIVYKNGILLQYPSISNPLIWRLSFSQGLVLKLIQLYSLYSPGHWDCFCNIPGLIILHV